MDTAAAAVLKKVGLLEGKLGARIRGCRSDGRVVVDPHNRVSVMPQTYWDG